MYNWMDLMVNHNTSMQLLLLFNLITVFKHRHMIFMSIWLNMDVCVCLQINSPYKICIYCNMTNLGNFNGDYGFCDRLLCGN